MKRWVLAAAIPWLWVRAVAGSGAEDAVMAPNEEFPPPIPRYVIRGPDPQGGRLETGRDGRQLYRSRCGFCHLEWGMGSNLLLPQRLAAGASADSALLENRRDLESDYIEAVVRRGTQAMPPLSRVEVTDAELRAIARYLEKAGR